MNNILRQLIGLEVKASLGAPALLPELRNDLPGMNKIKFDQDVLNLAKSGEYILIKHSDPGSLTMQEKVMMIPDGEGGFYDSILPLPEKKPVTPRRKGRPPLPAQMKRVHLRASCSVPKWIDEWLKKEGDSCKLIEAALIEKFKLVPPEDATM